MELLLCLVLCLKHTSNLGKVWEYQAGYGETDLWVGNQIHGWGLVHLAPHPESQEGTLGLTQVCREKRGHSQGLSCSLSSRRG